MKLQLGPSTLLGSRPVSRPGDPPRPGIGLIDRPTTLLGPESGPRAKWMGGTLLGAAMVSEPRFGEELLGTPRRSGSART